jgi:cytochrome b6-f complex iron-sulfur subunit
MGPSPAETPTVEMGRRRLLRWLLGFSFVSSAAMVLTPVMSFLVPPKTQGAGGGEKVLAGKTTDIPPGEGKVVAMGSRPVIVVNSAQGPTAFSAICTHLGCIVAWDGTQKQIRCPCHDGVFNPATGAVISGPPPAPLSAVKVAVEKDQIFLLGS